MESSSGENTTSSENEFTINPETGMIVSDGHEYANTPRMREFIRRANEIRSSLPPTPEDTLRLWRGNRPDEVGENPSFTNSLEGIALPFLDSYEGDLSYIEIPRADSGKYVTKDSEFNVPTEIAKTAKVVIKATPPQKKQPRNKV